MPKLCEHLNCRQTAYYGLFYAKPIYCKEHKGTTKYQYRICVCGEKRPIYGLIGDKRASCCKKCKDKDMHDITNKKCIECKITRPTFGLDIDKPASHCEECKTDDMVAVSNLNKICCECKEIRASYGFDENKSPTHCVKCKKDGMTTFKKKCIVCNIITPSYGLNIDLPPTHCVKCKTDDMESTKPKCTICNIIIPIFGLDLNAAPTHCVTCKTPEMFDVVHKNCIICNIVQPSFGITSRTHCAKCKTDNMIQVNANHCIICDITNPCFGFKDHSATHCTKCKEPGMSDVRNLRCLCGESTSITYGLEDYIKPTCCVKCKTPDMVDIKTLKCKANEQGILCTTKANKKYKNYCTHCFAHLFPLDPLTFQIRCKTKEIATRDFINSIYEGFKHDKPLWIGSCDCTHKRRIDHYYLLGNTLICVETDEFQHKGYNKYDEEIRYDDLMMVHGGKFIFIRFNPDKYKEKGVSKNPTIANRLRELSKEIDKQIKRVDNDENTELVEIIKMYYDN
jgi:hypothetical protein